MRSRQAKLARETSPVYCHQLGFTTKFHPGSQSLASNRQGAQHQILRNAFKPAAAGFCGWDQGQEQVDRCHHRCRRKTFRTGHNHRPSTCSAWKTLFNQTTGSTTLASCLLAIKEFYAQGTVSKIGMAMRIFLAMRIDSDMSDIIAPHFSDRQPFRIYILHGHP